jgi:hypothetical protein
MKNIEVKHLEAIQGGPGTDGHETEIEIMTYEDEDDKKRK